MISIPFEDEQNSLFSIKYGQRNSRSTDTDNDAREFAFRISEGYHTLRAKLTRFINAAVTNFNHKKRSGPNNFRLNFVKALILFWEPLIPKINGQH